MKTYDVTFSDKCRVHATSKRSAREIAREIFEETLMDDDDFLEVTEPDKDTDKAPEMGFREKSEAFEKDLRALLEKYQLSMFIENEEYIGILDKNGEDDYIKV